MFDLIKKHKWLLTTGIISVALILSLLNNQFSLRKNNKSYVATVNVNAIMTNYIQKQAKLNINSAHLQEATTAFVRQLEKEIKILSDKKAEILFVSEAVLAGGHDYTAELEQNVYLALSKSGVPK